MRTMITTRLGRAMLVERARQNMRQAIRSLAMTVDRWSAAWKPIEESAPWYAEVVVHHKFSTDQRREDSATRCPACGSHGHIAHGERRRCKCGLRMSLAGNSLALWTGRIPQHSADLALPARETNLIQLERHKRPGQLHRRAGRRNRAPQRRDIPRAEGRVRTRAGRGGANHERTLPKLRKSESPTSTSAGLAAGDASADTSSICARSMRSDGPQERSTQ